MSKDYSVEVVLEVEYSTDSIRTVLKKGALVGLTYRDYIGGEIYEFAPALCPDRAAQRIISADALGREEGPSVYITYDNGGFFLWCYQSEQGKLSVHFSGFGSQKEKDGSFDFAYYIRLLLDLCDDFVILSLRTEIIP